MRFLAGIQALFALTAALSVLTDSASAQPEAISGRDDPRYKAAIELWLDDNDRSSLPALVELGHDGNEAARVFLYLLLRRPDLQSSWVAGLSHEEQRAIFRPRRSGGSPFGGWWNKGDEQPQIVESFSSKSRGTFRGSYLIDRIGIGEPRLAFRESIELGFTYWPDFRQDLLQLDPLPDHWSFVRRWGDAFADRPDISATVFKAIIQEDTGRPIQDAMFQFTSVMNLGTSPEWPKAPFAEDWLWHRWPSFKRSYYLVYGYWPPSMELHANTPVHDTFAASSRDTLQEWLGESELSEHYRRLCHRSCGTSEAACRLAAYRAHGGFWGLYGADTPSEVLIPSEEFRTSRRAEMLPARSFINSVGQRVAIAEGLSWLDEIDVCFADRVRAEIKEHIAAGSYLAPYLRE